MKLKDAWQLVKASAAEKRAKRKVLRGLMELEKRLRRKKGDA